MQQGLEKEKKTQDPCLDTPAKSFKYSMLGEGSIYKSSTGPSRSYTQVYSTLM
jgi:hypothetical protein